MSERIWLYILAEEVGDGICKGPCKIGISSNPWRRAQALEAGCPGGTLLVVHAYGLPHRPMAQDLETHFHKWQRRNRIHREWFGLEPEDAMHLVYQHICATFDERPFHDDLMNLLLDATYGGRTDLCGVMGYV